MRKKALVCSRPSAREVPPGADRPHAFAHPSLGCCCANPNQAVVPIHATAPRPSVPLHFRVGPKNPSTTLNTKYPRAVGERTPEITQNGFKISRCQRSDRGGNSTQSEIELRVLLSRTKPLSREKAIKTRVTGAHPLLRAQGSIKPERNSECSQPAKL